MVKFEILLDFYQQYFSPNMLFWLIGLCLLDVFESRLVGHTYRNGAMSSINKFMSQVRSLLSEEEHEEKLEDGHGRYIVVIIVIVSCVFLLILLAYAYHRYKQWRAAKRRGSKAGVVETDALIEPTSGTPSTVVVPESATSSNIFTRK